MMECPRCHKFVPDDSIYCQFCGKHIVYLEEEEGKVVKKTKKAGYRKNDRPNPFGKVALGLFLGTIIIFDFALATLCTALGWPHKWCFVISSVLYIAAIASGAYCLYIDHVDNTNGLEGNGDSGLALAGLCLSLYTILVNIQNVF